MEEKDILSFFEDHLSALPLYEAFEKELFRRYPQCERRIQKTQISFYNTHMFACVSFAKVKRKAEMPDPCIVITLGLPYSLNTGRAAVKSEPYPGRWTTHIVIGSINELDEELYSLVEEAYDYAIRKRRKPA